MTLLAQILDVYSWIIIIAALISWFPLPPDHPIPQFLHTVTEPVLGPLRKLVSPAMTGGLDISPILAILALRFLSSFLRGL